MIRERSTSTNNRKHEVRVPGWVLGLFPRKVRRTVPRVSLILLASPTAIVGLDLNKMWLSSITLTNDRSDLIQQIGQPPLPSSSLVPSLSPC